MYFCRQTLF